MALNATDRAVLLGHRLSDPSVRIALASFLATELREIWKVEIAPPYLAKLLDAYVQAVDQHLALAETILDRRNAKA